MSPLDLSAQDIGQALRIETKVKSRPIRGTILEVVVRPDHVVVTLQHAYGTKSHLLTESDEVSVDA